MQFSPPQVYLKHHRSYLLDTSLQLGKPLALCLGRRWWEGVANGGKGWWEGFVQNQVGLCLRDSTVVVPGLRVLRSRGMGGKGRLQTARRGCGSSHVVAVSATRLSWSSVVFLTHQGGWPRWKWLFWVEWHFLIHGLCLSPGYPTILLGLPEICAVIALKCCLVCQQPVGRDPRLLPHQIYQLIPT